MKSIVKEIFNKDIQVVFELLQLDAACNGLVMSDLEKEGSNPRVVQVYGAFEENEAKAILLCLKVKLAYFPHENRDVESLIP
jgi:hypothetical protein